MYFNRDDIAELQELQVSFMPTGLPLLLTDRELRDLVAFLDDDEYPAEQWLTELFNGMKTCDATVVAVAVYEPYLEWTPSTSPKNWRREVEQKIATWVAPIAAEGITVDHLAQRDLHPADGVYSNLPSCNQFHTKGIYTIPLRCYYSKNIRNLFLAGRIISSTHVAFGSTRVMATCASGGQAVGMAAALCVSTGLLPSELLKGSHMAHLQTALNLSGQSIPHIPLQDENNLMGSATVQASSTIMLREIPSDGPWLSLETAACQMIPITDQDQLHITVRVKAAEPTLIKADLRIAERPGNYTPDIVCDEQEHELEEKAAEYIIKSIV